MVAVRHPWKIRSTFENASASKNVTQPVVATLENLTTLAPDDHQAAPDQALGWHQNQDQINAFVTAIQGQDVAN